MLIIWSAVFGVLFFLGLVLITLLLGAVANKAEKEFLARAKAGQEAGLTGSVTSEAPRPLHER